MEKRKPNLKTIPTLIGLFVLTVGIASGVFLIQERTGFLSKASPSTTPKQINITNITDSSFTVSWITDEKTTGFVKFGKTDSLDQIAKDDRDQASGQTQEFLTHHATTRGLQADTDYKFRISSKGQLFDNNGQSYQLRTAKKQTSNTPQSDVAYGTVETESGSPAEGAIVYLSISGVTKQSTLVKSSGSWVIPLNLAFSSNLLTYAQYDKANTREELYVNAGTGKTAAVTTTTANDSPVPLITLNKNQNFDSNLPAIPTSTPIPASRGGFGTSDFDQSPGISTVTISNPQEGEKINTQSPEFFGKGPAGTTLEITLESENTITNTIIVASSGDWSWVPSQALNPGEHSLTISYKGSSGETKTTTRNFTVLAAGTSNLPSIDATPSANIVPTATPTLTPTLTPTPIPTTTPTTVPQVDNDIPVSGDLTPTLMLAIMGLGLILFGFFTKALSKIND
ncbi:MAG: fibronectin type III domain-containing protein [Patescibacteria group bacterium]